MKKIVLLLLMISFSSCDRAIFASVTNQKNEPYNLKIYYNANSEKIKDYIDHHKNFENFSKFIVKYNNYNFKKDIINDSIEKSTLIKLSPKDSFTIWGGIFQLENFDEIEKIELINSNNQITEIKGSEISTSFELKEGVTYLYTIK
ncbi:hypothetical protein [Flavobacterium sp.]|uniref:hypothetical protein n=1 Tax=Flavobacterium sp. TaxID=239 RepID=UPI0026226D95|nr:hypothetical protein [Flavobacterium sp.]